MPPKTIDLSSSRSTLLASLLSMAQAAGAKHVIAQDLTRATLNYSQLMIGAMILKNKFAPLLEGQKFVAVMLPNVNGAMVTFAALQMLGKVPCMLNYSAGESNILHACAIAGAKTVLTSRAFIEKGKLEALAAALEKQCTLVYLEDIRKNLGFGDKMKGMLATVAPHAVLKDVLAKTTPDDVAVVLYTSGSEGRPKGVALSHANLLSNIAQIIARIDLSTKDTVFNALPIFHSFGLAIGLILPMMRGIKTYLFPSPLMYREIPRAVRESHSTILLGTDTFLRGWSTYAKPEDFQHVRLAVAGAEKLKDSTRTTWHDKFDVEILQGYGVTETSPVISCNTPDAHKPGTVGTAFPNIECRLEPVAGLAEGGRLFVKGPNVMLGYLDPENPGTVKPQGEWYDTGDIVTIDAQGFITIQGRAKRFAKLGGEMVSLVVVEEVAFAASPDAIHAATVAPDAKKGEQIVLFTEDKNLTREMLTASLREKGLPELYLPKQIIALDCVPRLGNGKVDYPTLTKNNPIS